MRISRCRSGGFYFLLGGDKFGILKLHLKCFWEALQAGGAMYIQYFRPENIPR